MTCRGSQGDLWDDHQPETTDGWLTFFCGAQRADATRT